MPCQADALPPCAAAGGIAVRKGNTCCYIKRRDARVPFSSAACSSGRVRVRRAPAPGHGPSCRGDAAVAGLVRLFRSGFQGAETARPVVCGGWPIAARPGGPVPRAGPDSPAGGGAVVGWAVPAAGWCAVSRSLRTVPRSDPGLVRDGAGLPVVSCRIGGGERQGRERAGRGGLLRRRTSQGRPRRGGSHPAPRGTQPHPPHVLPNRQERFRSVLLGASRGAGGAAPVAGDGAVRDRRPVRRSPARTPRGQALRGPGVPRGSRPGPGAPSGPGARSERDAGGAPDEGGSGERLVPALCRSGSQADALAVLRSCRGRPAAPAPEPGRLPEGPTCRAEAFAWCAAQPRQPGPRGPGHRRPRVPWPRPAHLRPRGGPLPPHLAAGGLSRCRGGGPADRARPAAGRARPPCSPPAARS